MAVWAAGTRAPVSVERTPARAAVLWGDAFSGHERADARAVGDGWAPAITGHSATTFDGFHASVVYSEGLGLVAGSDLLGRFPVYCWTAADVVIVASSPALFRAHPAFRHTLDHEGLFGILLSGSPTLGRTLSAGVRRLTAGTLWIAPDHGRPVEVPYYGLPEDEALRNEPLRAQAAALADALGAAVAQQVPTTERAGLLLSGGRDSRMYAGYLSQQGTPADALTFGIETDHDAMYARAVAAACGFSHRLHALDPDTLPNAATQHIRWTQLTAGFATVHTWSMLDAMSTLPSHFVTGYSFDSFMMRFTSTTVTPFEQVFPYINAGGVPIAHLSAMVSRSGRDDCIARARAGIEREYLQSTELPLQRGWRYAYGVADRSHSGAVPWRLSFGSWPVLPHLNRQVLDTLAAFPATSLNQRRVQDELLTTYFRRLARLPLDRNGEDTSPLISSRWDTLRRGWRRRAPDAVERRYFFRTFDFNGPAWRAVRRAAEPHRERLAELFDLDALERYLPGPDVRIEYENMFRESPGHKLLVGLMLWMAEQS